MEVIAFYNGESRDTIIREGGKSDTGVYFNEGTAEVHFDQRITKKRLGTASMQVTKKM